MSRGATARARELVPEREEAPGRPLRALEKPRRRRPRLAYALIALGGAVAIGAAQMGLSIATTQGSFVVSSLTQKQRGLVLAKQALYDDVAGLSSPQYLAANAAALGMVTGQSPTYLRLSDGSVVGAGQAATAASGVVAIGAGAVPNRLIATTPLVTDPSATIQGAPQPTAPAAAAADTLPPPITSGLPTPTTR